MLTRTTRTTVIFAHPFFLGDAEERLPAGTYDVETEEELLEGLSFHAYRRVLTVVHLPADAGQPGIRRSLTTRPEDLDIALALDAGASPTPRPAAPAKPEERARTEGGAIDRAENEGMSIVGVVPGDRAAPAP
ncbi:MAG: hypothetical protein LDL44_00710 [Caenispirillum sp.]|nr:hypothetical protein [Caenispirillum sp.]